MTTGSAGRTGSTVLRVTLVCGPPCAGKSTYVQAHAQRGDVVLDGVDDATVRRVLARARQAGTGGRVWVVRRTPGTARRAVMAKRLRAEVVLLAPSLEELIARARLTDHPQRTITSIHRWVETERRNPIPRMRAAKPKGKTSERGYDSNHKKLRAATLPNAYGQLCTRCGQPMVEGQELHLDHKDDRSGYRGYSHASCNTRAGAIKSNRVQRADLGKLRTSRVW